jgi:hypothetical protein
MTVPTIHAAVVCTTCSECCVHVEVDPHTGVVTANLTTKTTSVSNDSAWFQASGLLSWTCPLCGCEDSFEEE